MTDMILKGFAPGGDRFAQFLKEKFGATAHISGADFVVPEAQLKRFQPKPILTMHPQIKLEVGSEQQIASQMYAQIPEDMKEYQQPPPENIISLSQFGLLSEAHVVSTKLMVAPEPEALSVLRDEVLPLMVNKMAAEFVTAVTVDATYQQLWLSLSKIALLLERFGPEAMKTLVQDNNAFASVLPFGPQILWFVDALTRFSPACFTLPMHRQGCSWHFQGKGMWVFPAPLSNSFISRFMMTLSPLSADTKIVGLSGLAGMKEPMIWRFMRVVVDGVNRLMSFLNDPRNFMEGSGEVNFLKKVQSYSAAHLLFADVGALNFSTEAHSRVSYAMSALDKLANIRVRLSNTKGIGEGAAMVALASSSQREELKRVIQTALEKYGYHELATALTSVADTCYGQLHAHLRSQSPKTGESEKARLDRLRAQRNMRHGPFLDKSQFETLFFESDGSIPATIAALPYLLTIGLILDPSRFISFRPEISEA